MAVAQKTPDLMRRAESLRAALMIDRGYIKDAKAILESLVADFEEVEQ